MRHKRSEQNVRHKTIPIYLLWWQKLTRLSACLWCTYLCLNKQKKHFYEGYIFPLVFCMCVYLKNFLFIFIFSLSTQISFLRSNDYSIVFKWVGFSRRFSLLSMYVVVVIPLVCCCYFCLCIMKKTHKKVKLFHFKRKNKLKTFLKVPLIFLFVLNK